MTRPAPVGAVSGASGSNSCQKLCFLSCFFADRSNFLRNWRLGVYRFPGEQLSREVGCGVVEKSLDDVVRCRSKEVAESPSEGMTLCPQPTFAHEFLGAEDVTR